MEPCSHLQQRSNTSMDLRMPFSRLRDSGQQLEQGRFACAISPDDAHHFAARDLEGYVLQRPNRLVHALGLLRSRASEGRLDTSEGCINRVGQAITQRLVPLPLADAVALPQILNSNCDIAHTTSANVLSVRRKYISPPTSNTTKIGRASC